MTYLGFQSDHDADKEPKWPWARDWRFRFSQRSLFGDHTADKMTLGSRLSFYQTMLKQLHYDLVLSLPVETARKNGAPGCLSRSEMLSRTGKLKSWKKTLWELRWFSFRSGCPLDNISKNAGLKYNQPPLTPPKDAICERNSRLSVKPPIQ